MPRPLQGDFAPYMVAYVDKVKGENIHDLIAGYSSSFNEFIDALPETKADYAYAPNKWTVKDVLQHMIDAERVFIYRALRISRKDKTPLAGFEEDDYATNAFASGRSLNDLKQEFVELRKSTDRFLNALNDEQLSQSGTASNQRVTTNALAFICFGHIAHHIEILKDKYL